MEYEPIPTTVVERLDMKSPLLSPENEELWRLSGFDTFRIVMVEGEEMPDLYLNGQELKAWIKYELEQGCMPKHSRGTKVTIELFINLEVDNKPPKEV